MLLVLTYSQLMFYCMLFIDFMDLQIVSISPLDVFCTVFSYVAAAMVLACKKIDTLLFLLPFQHFLLYSLNFQTLSN